MAIPTAFRTSGIVLPQVEEYLRSLEWPRDSLLDEMRAQALAEGIPIVSEDTGQLLHLLLRIHAPDHVVEFGTAIGYSTVYMARALTELDTLTSFEIDPERHRQASAYLARAEAECEVDLRCGDARELARAIPPGEVDFAFLDAAKGEYRDYLTIVLERMEPGGVIVVDNALMSGTVASGASDGHWSRESIDAQRAFNAAFTSARRVRGMVLPLGDGVAVGVV